MCAQLAGGSRTLSDTEAARGDVDRESRSPINETRQISAEPFEPKPFVHSAVTRKLDFAREGSRYYLHETLAFLTAQATHIHECGDANVV